MLNNSSLKYYITKDFLIKEYIVNKKTMSNLAKESGCSNDPIRRNLNKYNIPIRSKSEALRGIPKTQEHKNKIRLGNLNKHNHWGSNNPNFGNKGEKNPLYGKKRPEHSKRMSGKNSPLFGRQTKPPRWGKYKDINMRSSWEIAYAKWLDKKNIKWEYEPKVFNLGFTTYTPDFYLPEQQVYVEIKGWMRKEALIKIKEFIRQRPDIKYLLLGEKELKKELII